MNKPEKKEYKICQGHITGKVGNPIERRHQSLCEGYNQAIDEYEEFLPSTEEIIKIVYDWKNLVHKSPSPDLAIDCLAQIIAKRMRIGKL